MKSGSLYLLLLGILFFILIFLLTSMNQVEWKGEKTQQTRPLISSVQLDLLEEKPSRSFELFQNDPFTGDMELVCLDFDQLLSSSRIPFGPGNKIIASPISLNTSTVTSENGEVFILLEPQFLETELLDNGMNVCHGKLMYSPENEIIYGHLCWSGVCVEVISLDEFGTCLVRSLRTEPGLQLEDTCISYIRSGEVVSDYGQTDLKQSDNTVFQSLLNIPWITNPWVKNFLGTYTRIFRDKHPNHLVGTF